MRPGTFLVGLERELRRGVLPIWILEELAEGGPLYGYLLMERLRHRGGPGFSITPSSLYPALGRMRALGLVEVFHGVESRGPVRKYYRLTREGRAGAVAARAMSERLYGASRVHPGRTGVTPDRGALGGRTVAR